MRSHQHSVDESSSFGSEAHAHPGRSTQVLIARREREGGAAPTGDVPALPGSGGVQLPEGLRSRFESSVGTDLGAVRLHTGTEAGAAADALGARAFVTGQDISFGAGEFNPGTAAGDELIAHEVAHTVQQRGAGPALKAKVTESGDAVEVEADQAASRMVRGEAVQLGASSGDAIALKKKKKKKAKTKTKPKKKLESTMPGMEAAVLSIAESVPAPVQFGREMEVYEYARVAGVEDQLDQWVADYNFFCAPVAGLVRAMTRAMMVQEMTGLSLADMPTLKAEIEKMGKAVAGDKSAKADMRDALSTHGDDTATEANKALTTAKLEMDAARLHLNSMRKGYEVRALEKRRAAKGDELAAIEAKIDRINGIIGSIESFTVSAISTFATGGLYGVAQAGASAVKDHVTSGGFVTSVVGWMTRDAYKDDIQDIQEEIARLSAEIDKKQEAAMLDELNSASKKLDAAGTSFEEASIHAKNTRAGQRERYANAGEAADDAGFKGSATAPTAKAKHQASDGRGEQIMTLLAAVRERSVYADATHSAIQKSSLKSSRSFFDALLAIEGSMPQVHQTEDGGVELVEEYNDESIPHIVNTQLPLVETYQDLVAGKLERWKAQEQELMQALSSSSDISNTKDY